MKCFRFQGIQSSILPDQARETLNALEKGYLASTAPGMAPCVTWLLWCHFFPRAHVSQLNWSQIFKTYHVVSFCAYVRNQLFFLPLKITLLGVFENSKNYIWGWINRNNKGKEKTYFRVYIQIFKKSFTVDHTVTGVIQIYRILFSLSGVTTHSMFENRRATVRDAHHLSHAWCPTSAHNSPTTFNLRQRCWRLRSLPSTLRELIAFHRTGNRATTRNWGK